MRRGSAQHPSSLRCYQAGDTAIGPPIPTFPAHCAAARTALAQPHPSMMHAARYATVRRPIVRRPWTAPTAAALSAAPRFVLLTPAAWHGQEIECITAAGHGNSAPYTQLGACGRHAGQAHGRALRAGLQRAPCIVWGACAAGEAVLVRRRSCAYTWSWGKRGILTKWGVRLARTRPASARCGTPCRETGGGGPRLGAPDGAEQGVVCVKVES